MRLSLLVLSAGKLKGKAIPITLSQFLIGRDPQCHLRPASPKVSNRHCALLVRRGRVYVRDFQSTNGTFVNEKPIMNEVQLCDQDLLRVGPVVFTVQIEGADEAASPAAQRPPAEVADDAVAAMLLSLQEQEAESGAEEVPTGSTVMDRLPNMDDLGPIDPQAMQPPPPGHALGDTSSVAKDLLRKYRRRPPS